MSWLFCYTHSVCLAALEMTALLSAHACNRITDTVCTTVQVLLLANDVLMTCFGELPLLLITYVNAR